MLSFPGIIIATVIIFLPGFDSQCVDCASVWKTHCWPNQTGYHCMKGAEIVKEELTPAEYATSTPDPRELYSPCVPYPLHLEYVRSWCCFWSDKVGCQIALHPQLYKYENPVHYCEHCKTKCVCKYSSSTDMKPWYWIYLGSVTVLLAQVV